MPHPDQRYIQALRENNPKLIQEINQNFRPAIIALCKKNSGNHQEGEDLFQEALLAIWRRVREQGIELHVPFGAYLYRVAKNKWINILKQKARREVTFEDLSGYEGVEGDSEALERLELIERQEALIWERFKELSDRCQEILKGAWSQTFSSMESMADSLGVSYGYLRKKKSECTARLMKLVKESHSFQHLKNG
ncbi:MAG: sigma-70 family RNA polymerase sigma factor [Bacteroidia bacterium]|nr:sigma-70 family RNA polymerase sigma factor [Bacteroidia bacterium]